MRERIDIAVLSRRTFIIAGAAAAGLAPFIARADEPAPADTFTQSQDFKQDFARIVGSAKPIEGKVSVDLPETADNGNFVPITIMVDSPMTEADHVKAIHILSTENPHAHVATFRLSPVNAVARVQSRMRLAKTQDVIVLAELSGGEVLMSTTRVKVLIGGCGI
ncbi:MAG: thiosulfate oxidation carrier protein SoxY [Proteobacteria bacterium]|nr:thiosulfate oxidation carrier protein SoxY [Pseudomonadota bacterium]